MPNRNTTTVSDVGERELIKKFQQIITSSSKSLLEGDEDAVAIEYNELAIVVNSDMLVESTDVLPEMSPREIAWKAGVMALSDLAAKGATPYGVIFSLGIPKSSKEQEILELVEGLDLVCQRHETFYLGGDTNSCCELVIDSTAIGLIQKEKIIRRKGARPGDIVAITGEFGYTGALFEAALKKRTEPQEIVQRIKEKALRPIARLKEGQALAQGNLASAAIDSSDGLAWSLHELAKASQVGFVIDKLEAPSICERFAHIHHLSLYDLMLYGGEEFELVVTIPEEKWKKANAVIGETGGQLIPIGIATKETPVILKTKDEEQPIEARGFEHFL